MSDFEQPGGDVVVPGPVEQLDSHAEPPSWTYPVGDILPAEPPAPPSRRVGRTAVAATLAVLLVLIGGGAAYGWTFLHRPDVALARAFDATKSAPSGDMTMSISTSKATGIDLLAGSSVRYAWGPGTQQVTVTMSGRQVGTVVTTDTHLTLQADLAATPFGSDATDQLKSMAAGLGPDGQVLADLADGKPVGVSTGPGSALRAAIDKAAASSGAGSASSSASNISPDQIASVADSIAQAVKDEVTVTDAGSDKYGDHVVVTLPMAKVAASAWQHLSTLAPGLAAGAKPDLSSLDGVTLTADVWMRDGVLSRIEVPLSPALGKATSTPAVDATLIVVMGTAGVQAPAGPVTDVPDSLISSLTGNG